MITALFLQLGAWNLGPFSRHDIINPILGPNPKSSFDCPMRKTAIRWEHDHVFNPGAIVRNGKVYLLYRAEDDSGQGIGAHTSRVGLAESIDGLHFDKRKVPVLFPAEDSQKPFDWTGGCEDPRVVEGPGGQYVMTYTAWNGKTARLSVAVSPDLIHWTKTGPAFAGTKFADTWSKSGAIVTRLTSGRLVAAKIGGSYWMYWGDNSIHLAKSSDLKHWKPVTDSDGSLVPALTVRKGKFDSLLVESGPPAVLTKQGIVLIYNGANKLAEGDKTLGDGMYAAGQALFDPKSPGRLLARTDSYFIRPESADELTGQYKAGTVFTEGLVYFKNRWLLYYGAADSFVGAAIAK